MKKDEVSVNRRELTYNDIKTYIDKKPIKDLCLYEFKPQISRSMIDNVLEDLEKNDCKKDFIKKIIIAPENPAHTNVLIYGVCNGKKICFTLTTDFYESVMPYFSKKFSQGKKSDITFILSDIHVDSTNCGVFAIESCKHLNLDDFRKILSNEQENLKKQNVLNHEIFYIKTILLPASLQKYDQQMSNNKLNELKQKYPEEYMKLTSKIKPKNFSTDKYGKEKLPLDTEQINVDNCYNKAASYKRKKIVDLADQKKKENGIG